MFSLYPQTQKPVETSEPLEKTKDGIYSNVIGCAPEGRKSYSQISPSVGMLYIVSTAVAILIQWVIINFEYSFLACGIYTYAITQVVSTRRLRNAATSMEEVLNDILQLRF